MRLVALAPDGLASLAQGGGAPLNAVPGWPHRDTLPLLWTAWQAGGAAWLVTADGAPVEGTPVEDTPVLGTSIQGTVVGECAAKGPLIRGAPAEIGYGLAPRARGRGYGRRLVAELVSILQGVGVSEIRAQTSADNIASRRVLERAGFQICRELAGPTTLSYVLRSRRADTSGPDRNADPRTTLTRGPR